MNRRGVRNQDIDDEIDGLLEQINVFTCRLRDLHQQNIMYRNRLKKRLDENQQEFKRQSEDLLIFSDRNRRTRRPRR